MNCFITILKEEVERKAKGRTGWPSEVWSIELKKRFNENNNGSNKLKTNININNNNNNNNIKISNNNGTKANFDKKNNVVFYQNIHLLKNNIDVPKYHQIINKSSIDNNQQINNFI